MNTAKKSIIAFALVTPMALAACGSDEETADNAAGSSTAATSGAAPAGQGDANDAEKDAAAESSQAAESAPAEEGAESQAPETLVNPFEGDASTLEGVAQDPLESGQPADEATINEIRALNEGLYATTNFRDFTMYIPERACKSVLDAQQVDMDSVDLNMIPATPMTDMDPNWGSYKVESVTDVVVDGNVATASVTVSTANGPDTSTMRFEREDNQWKFCSQ